MNFPSSEVDTSCSMMLSHCSRFDDSLQVYDKSTLKTMSLNITQQFMKERVKHYFGLLKMQVKFLIN